MPTTGRSTGAPDALPAGNTSPAAQSQDLIATATGAIAVGASVVLGALALAVATAGLVSLLAAVMAHAGLLCMTLGVHLLLKRGAIDPLIRRAYLALTFAFAVGIFGTDFAILLGK